MKTYFTVFRIEADHSVRRFAEKDYKSARKAHRICSKLLEEFPGSILTVMPILRTPAPKAMKLPKQVPILDGTGVDTVLANDPRFASA